MPQSLRRVVAVRYERSPHGTFSKWLSGDAVFDAIELPWKQNLPNVSCIPAGEYLVKVRKSPKYGRVYWITDVEGRSWILQHAGNFAGDRSKGLRTNSLGCILLGMSRGVINGQKAVLNSRVAIDKFMRFMGGEDFKLTIVEAL